MTQQGEGKVRPAKKHSVMSAQRRWERNVESWAAFVRGNHDLIRRFLINPWVRTIAKELCGKSILDAGCGEGGYSRIFAAAGAKVTGVDFSERMILAAQEYEKLKPLGIRYAVGDLVDLGVKPSTFDGVVCIMTLMAIQDLRHATAEIARVLRPKGRVFLVINHPCFSRPDNGNYFTPARLVWRFYPDQAAPTLFFIGLWRDTWRPCVLLASR
jgi:2-polyprenyl-3-methyl-5-hydroxy-6-metoxy-1,4-benzoquinol methylase